MSSPSSSVETLRLLSRRFVRELGFMGGSFAGTALSPSAVHALIEIEASDGMTANDLAALLRLEKSSVSRMLRKLVLSGDVTEAPSETDSRSKRLSLSADGRRRVAAIHGFARSQVSTALNRLCHEEEETVLEGLRLYVDALQASGGDRQAPVEIRSGYRTGLIARITQMHAHHYSGASGFGRSFESVVAGGLAAFCERLDHPANGIWVAMRGAEIVGSVAIDGEDLGPGTAHLRWFIVDDGMRGSGVGKRLLAEALGFADRAGCAETHLWTFAGLDAARRLYEANGFACVEERPGRQWGSEVLEQRFVRERPVGAARE